MQYLNFSSFNPDTIINFIWNNTATSRLCIHNVQEELIMENRKKVPGRVKRELKFHIQFKSLK